MNCFMYDNKDRLIPEDRKSILLKACLHLLKKQEESLYVLDILSETVHYDGEEIDGYCLMEDIKIELDLDEI